MSNRVGMNGGGEGSGKIVEKTIAKKGILRNFFRLIFGAILPIHYG